MSQIAMPLVLFNLAGEMLYVLDQRLTAQSIPVEKSIIVMRDVVGTTFDKAFVRDKVMPPQDTFSLSSTKHIFNKLAHSSIMRLNEQR